MASLPCPRVTAFERPFASTGVDYFGPFLIKQGRSQVKRYGCIFTCLAIRAIHIEVAHSLDAESFLSRLAVSPLDVATRRRSIVTMVPTSWPATES